MRENLIAYISSQSDISYLQGNFLASPPPVAKSTREKHRFQKQIVVFDPGTASSAVHAFTRENMLKHAKV